MKVRMRIHMSGTRDGIDWPPPGSVIELPDDEATQYCAAGIADPVTTFADAQTTVAPEPEKRGSGSGTSVRARKQTG